MNPRAEAGALARRLRRLVGGLGVLAGVLMPLQARADWWVIESSLNTGVESNDNVSLARDSPGTVHTASQSISIDASRQRENSVTRLQSGVTALRQTGPGGRDRVDGRFGLTQSVSDPLNTFTFELQHARDFNETVGDADASLGPGQRRTTSLAGSWSRALSERTSANARAAVGQTGFGRQLEGAIDYRDASLSTGLSYGLDEATSLGLQGSFSTYEPADDNNRSRTLRSGISLSRAFSERSSASVNLGGYRTTSSAATARLACPLEVSYCVAGVVPFVLVSESQRSSRRGLEYGASTRFQFSEITDGSLAVARQQVPSGVGALVRSDTLRATVNRSFSPTLTGSLDLARSRSASSQDTDALEPGRSSLSMSMTKRFAPELSLQFALHRTRADGSGARAGQAARSNSVSLVLSYDGPRAESSR